jgi:hypothetical protein
MKFEIVQPTRDIALPDGDRRLRLIGWGVNLLWKNGGILYHRPHAVEVRTADQPEPVERLPVVDATRVVELACFAIGVAIGTRLWFGRRTEQR